MSIMPLLALPAGLEITAFSRQKGTLCMSVLSTQSCSPCPVCGFPATRIHSRYQRRLADLPCAGQPVRFLLTVRKFFCDVPTCPRKIFAERLTPFVAPWARVTARLFQTVQIIGLATGDRLGVRVTDRMGIQTSRITILRCSIETCSFCVNESTRRHLVCPMDVSFPLPSSPRVAL
jgi:hypothetical protein